ncbi:MAG: hypothetical protein K8M05_21265 [Deltaproteobacteria bacterium]|nr:hypothetical protein [Kofleriaceae bacterium]
MRDELGEESDDDFAPPYARARACIRQYAHGVISRSAALRRAAELRKQVEGERSVAKQRGLVNNAGMIEYFVNHFDMVGVQRIEPECFQFDLDGVVVRFVPDVCIRRNGTDQFVKLFFAKKRLPKTKRLERKAMSHLMHAARKRSRPVASSRDLYIYDVRFAEPIICMPADDDLKRKFLSVAEEIREVSARLKDVADGRSKRPPGTKPRT